MKKEKILLTTAGGGRFPRLARVMTCLMLMLTGLGTGAWAQEPATTYSVKMKDGTVDADKWTISPNPAPEGSPVTVKYNGRLKVKGVKATSDAAPAGNSVDLSTLTADYEAQDGETLTGTLAGNYKISIADGATVTLDGVTINGVNDESYKWAGITCLGDATIILSGTNTVKGFYEDYPGIFVPENKTLTIQGDGSLNASSNGYGAGIGGGFVRACGNITIEGGTITATGGTYAAGIGGGNNASCGNISITGGTVTATGGNNAPGIGGGRGDNNNTLSSCGDITIANTVTKVTATKGENAPNSIGAGYWGTCGTVTIGGVEGAITTSPYTYDPAAAAVPAEGHALSASVVGEIVGTDGKAYAAADKGNLPTGVTAVAMVAYKSATAGSSLAIALADEGSMYWETAKTTCAGKTAIGGNSWKLPSQDEWKQMFGANGGNNGSYTGLNTAITTAGGTALQEYDSYWSSTPGGADDAWLVYLDDGFAGWFDDRVDGGDRVRACLAF